jgi:hypothetical protein
MGSVLGALAFAAYCIGILWLNIQRLLLAVAGLLLTKYELTFTQRLYSWRWSPKTRRELLTSFTTAEGAHADLLPRLGVRRPASSALGPDERKKTMCALERDLQWFHSVVPDQAPALADRFYRRRGEARFAAALAVPLASGAVALGAAIWPGWGGVLLGSAAALVGGFSMGVASATMTTKAWECALDAIHLGFLEAPTLIAYGLEQWGPADPETPTREAGDVPPRPDQDAPEVAPVVPPPRER